MGDGLSPGFDTILKILGALGIKLHAEVARSSKLTAQQKQSI
jgi:DNA-binding phage protein